MSGRRTTTRRTEDTDIGDYFIRVAFPSRPLAEAVVGLLTERAGPVKVDELLREVNIGKARLEAMLKVLDVEGAVERVSAAVYARTAPGKSPTGRWGTGRS